MAATRRLSELTADSRRRLQLPDGHLAVALSGGADSAALAYLVREDERVVRAIHVDHGTLAAAELRSAAAAVAERLEIDLSVESVKLSGAFSEDRARKMRYDAFDSMRRPREWVLTAHTRDDQAETVLMNLVRGAGVEGLSGIPTLSRGWLARPVLDVTRGDLRELAQLVGLPYADDPSNADVALTRNRIRHTILPQLSELNPALVESLARTAALLRDDLALAERLGESITVGDKDGGVALAVGSLQAVERPVASILLRRVVREVRPPYPPTVQELDRIWTVVDGSSAATELEGGIRVERSGPMVMFITGRDRRFEPNTVALQPGVHHLGPLVLEVARHYEPCRAAPLGTWRAVFPADTMASATLDEAGGVVVTVASEPAWIPGVRRLPVAFLEPGTTGYLSVLATEESGWTSNP